MNAFYNLSQKMQVEFSNFFKPLCRNLNKAESNLLKSASKSLLQSNSLILRQIAQYLPGKTFLKKKEKRLSYHLSKCDLNDKLMTNLLLTQSSKITDESLIIIDGSDITKPSANKMDGLKKIRDGSTGKQEKGFHLLNGISLTKTISGYDIHPLFSELFSTDKEIDSEKNILFDRLNDICLFSENKGTYVFDRLYDDRYVFNFMNQQESNYIIRAKNNRTIYVDGEKYSFRDAAKMIELTHTYFDSFTKKKFKYGVKKVSISLDSYPKKKAPNLINVYLTVARFPNNGGYFYYFSNFPREELSEKQVGEKCLRCYRLRWKIEEVHRQLKQDFGWEKIQLLNYNRLKMLNTVFWITASFLYSTKRFLKDLLEVFKDDIISKKNDKVPLMGFVFYRLTRAVKKLFFPVKQRSKIKAKFDRMQMVLKF